MERDIAEKRLEEHEDVFADIINTLLFDGEKVCRAESLEPVPTADYHRSERGVLRQRSRDVIKKDRRNETVLLIMGIENQDSCDNTMAVRVMGYDFASYDSQIGEIMKKNRRDSRPACVKGIHDGQKLAPVLTLVLYFGREAWRGPKNLKGLLNFPNGYGDKIQQFIPDYRFNLVEMARLPETVRKRFTSDFGLVADFIAGQDDPVLRRQIMEDTTRKILHPEEILDVLGALGRDNRYRTIKARVIERSEEEDVTMCIIAEELENRGIRKGMQEGEHRLGQLNLKLLADKRYEDLEKASGDKDFRHRLFKEYGL